MRKIDIRTYTPPSADKWTPEQFAELERDILNFDVGLRNINSAQTHGPGTTREFETFRAGQERDRTAALIIAAASFTIVGALFVLGLIVRNWAVMSAWWGKW